MLMKKNKTFYLVCLLAYSFLVIFNPILHGHALDGRDHDHCQSCNWVANAQVRSANLILIELLLLILFVLFHSKVEFKPLNLVSISSRAPPLVLI